MAGRSRVKSIHTPPEQVSSLLNRIDSPAVRGDRRSGGPRRVNSRFPYRQDDIGLSLSTDNRSKTFVVYGRNISRGGIAFLHCAYVHKGTLCELTLPRLDGGSQTAAGIVVASRHVEGMVHEVCVRFCQAVDPKAFVDPETMAATQSHGGHAGDQPAHAVSDAVAGPSPAAPLPPGVRQTDMDEFHAHAKRAADEIESCISPPRLGRAVNICIDLAMSSAKTGHSQIASLANRVLERLDQTASVAATATLLRDLRQLCLACDHHVISSRPNTRGDRRVA